MSKSGINSKNQKNISSAFYILPILLVIIGYFFEYQAENNKGLRDNEPSEWNEVLDSLKVSKGFGKEFQPSKNLLMAGFAPCIPDFIENKGAEQKKSWAKKMYQALDDSAVSGKRLTILQQELTDRWSPLFLTAREKYDQEKIVFDTQHEKIKKIRIKTGRDYMLTLAAVYVAILFISIFCSVMLNVLSNNNILLLSELTNWKKSYFVFVLVLFFSNTSLSIITSVLETDKQWIIPASFFVSWEAWLWERVSVFGVAMINAIPLTQLWCYSRKEYIPGISLTELGGEDGKFAVEKYILFLQICTISIFVALSLITVILLKWASSQQNNFDSAYLYGVIYLSILLMIFVGKLIRNAVLLRLEYQQRISEHFKTWDELLKGSVLPDPTIDFIGESWWKLPVNFVSISTVIWALFNLTGISNLLLNAIK